MIAHKEYWDDVPMLGRAGRRWFRRRLYVITQNWLQSMTKENPEDTETAPLISAIVRELAVDPKGLLKWKDGDCYFGRGFSSGSYSVDVEAVLLRLPEVFAATAARLDAADFPQLDGWLDALQRDVLYSPGPAEPSRSTVLERLGLRVCRACRSAFVPDRRNAVRCAGCRRPARSREPR